MKLGFNKLTDYTVRFDSIRQPDGSIEYIAMIDTGKSDHNGSSNTPAEALVNAAMHWHAYTRKQEPTPPDNWHSPEWDNIGRVHDWRNYIADIMRAYWSGFTDEQKKAMAIGAAEQADKEE